MVTPAGWTRHSVGTGIASIPILTRDDADHVVAVPARPLLARDAMGRPKLSLTLVLSKCPSVGRALIAPLVTQGMIAFTATLALPDATAQLEEEAHKPVQPLFARSADFSLRYEGAELQHSAAFGPGATAAVSAMLDRQAALSVLQAIRDDSTDLRLECEVDYAVKDPPRRLRLRGDYTAIYRHLTQRGRQPLDRAALEQAIERMLYDGTLNADSEPEGASISMVTSAFLKVSSPVLQRVTAFDGERYSPRAPPPGQWLDTTLTSAGAGGHAKLSLMAGLNEMFRGCLDGEDSGAFIHLVAPDAAGDVVPAPPTSRAAAAARSACGPSAGRHFARANWHIGACVERCGPAQRVHRSERAHARSPTTPYNLRGPSRSRSITGRSITSCSRRRQRLSLPSARCPSSKMPPRRCG